MTAYAVPVLNVSWIKYLFCNTMATPPAKKKKKKKRKEMINDDLIMFLAWCTVSWVEYIHLLNLGGSGIHSTGDCIVHLLLSSTIDWFYFYLDLSERALFIESERVLFNVAMDSCSNNFCPYPELHISRLIYHILIYLHMFLLKKSAEICHPRHPLISIAVIKICGSFLVHL